jgi:two-component system, chemotaxis family, chemotaxis protein CheY
MIAEHLIMSFSEKIEGFRFFTNGEKAFVYLKECERENKFPHLLLIDQKMPDMDGIEFLSHYREQFQEKFPDTHVYVVTSSIRYSDMEKIKAFPFVKDYLVKPITQQVLAKLIDKQ